MSDTYQAIYDAVRSRMSNGNIGAAVADAINQQASGLSWAIEAVRVEFAQAADAQRRAAEEAHRPSVLFRPTLGIDGNQWCALYGSNLMEGVVAFGDTPEQAMAAFDDEWRKSIPLSSAREADHG